MDHKERAERLQFALSDIKRPADQVESIVQAFREVEHETFRNRKDLVEEKSRLARIESAALAIFSDLEVLDEIQDSTLAALRAALGEGGDKS